MLALSHIATPPTRLHSFAVVDTNERLRQSALRLIAMGMSGKALASAMGMSTGRFSKWKNERPGADAPSVEEGDRLDAFVDRAVSELVRQRNKFAPEGVQRDTGGVESTLPTHLERPDVSIASDGGDTRGHGELLRLLTEASLAFSAVAEIADEWQRKLKSAAQHLLDDQSDPAGQVADTGTHPPARTGDRRRTDRRTPKAP